MDTITKMNEYCSGSVEYDVNYSMEEFNTVIVTESPEKECISVIVTESPGEECNTIIDEDEKDNKEYIKDNYIYHWDRIGNDGIVSPMGKYNMYGNAIRCMVCDSLYHVQKDCKE